MREQLRHEIFVGLNTIEDIVGDALDYIAAEATTLGTERDLAIDAVAAKAIDRIHHELERVVEKAFRIVPIVGVAPPVMASWPDNDATSPPEVAENP